MATAPTPRPTRSRQEALVQRLSSTVLFARIAPHLLPPLDKAVHRLSGGKVMLSQSMLPSVFLTTTGRRSGEPRVAPLACLPERGGSFLVVGSNFGRTDHPAWTGNLIAEPTALVEHRGRTVQVTGALLDGAEREAAWAALLRMWPPYAVYQARIDRQIRVFRLTPAADGTEADTAAGQADDAGQSEGRSAPVKE